MNNKLPKCFAFKNTGTHPKREEIKCRYNKMFNNNIQYDLINYYYGRTENNHPEIFSESEINRFGSDVVEITEDQFLEMSEPNITEYEDNIKLFPKEVVEKMLEYQEKQGNKRDISVFERFPSANKIGGGFNWDKTEEGLNFWTKVIISGDFGTFFERYPKSKEKKILGYKYKDFVKDKWIAAVLNHISYNKDNHLLNGTHFSIGSQVHNKLKEAGVLDTWCELVYEEENKIFTLRCKDGEFELEVSKRGIYYAPENKFLNVKTLNYICEQIVLTTGTSTEYHCYIKVIDLGCKKNVPIEDLKKVVNEYKRLSQI